MLPLLPDADTAAAAAVAAVAIVHWSVRKVPKATVWNNGLKDGCERKEISLISWKYFVDPEAVVP